MIDQAMLMAAGLGTRLRPFTDEVPKPLLPVLGVPMARFPLEALRAAGVRRVVANVHHLAIRSHEGLRALAPAGTELIFSDESARLLGSAGGIRHALPHFGGKPFFVANSDVLCDVDLGALARCHARLREQWGVRLTLAVFRVAPGRGQYREILFDESRGLITKWGELKQGCSFYVGSAVFEPEAVAHLADGPSEFVPEVLLPAIEAGKAGVFVASGRWHDVGSPELWLDTHVELLRALETGALPREWRLRIEERNKRIAQEAWAWSGAPALLSRNVVGPCYWGGEGWGHSDFATVEVGPRVAVYGRRVAAPLHNGIAFNGKWVGVERG